MRKKGHLCGEGRFMRRNVINVRKGHLWGQDPQDAEIRSGLWGGD
jgi:hypothetical protein